MGFTELIKKLWLGSARLKIEIMKFFYSQISADRHTIVLDVTPFTSSYQAFCGITNTSKRTITIKQIKLKVSEREILCANHQPFELKPEQYRQLLLLFPIEPPLAQRRGHFMLFFIDDSGNIFERRGRFPIGLKPQADLYESG